MFSDVIPYRKILFAPLQDQERLRPILVYGKGEKKKKPKQS